MYYLAIWNHLTVARPDIILVLVYIKWNMFLLCDRKNGCNATALKPDSRLWLNMTKTNSSCIFRRSTNWLAFYSCFSFWWSLEKPFLKLGLDFGAFHRLRSELTISGQSLRPDFERSDQGPIRPSLLSSASKTDSFFKSKSELWNNKGSEIKKIDRGALTPKKHIFFKQCFLPSS